MESENTNSSSWPVTEWPRLEQAANAVGNDVVPINQLILTYHDPLRNYLKMAFPNLEGEADALLQDFAQDKLLREGWLAKASRQRGRFRDFLKTSLKYFVTDHLRRTRRAPMSLDELEIDLAAEESAAHAFDSVWVRTLLDEVLARMERDCLRPVKEQPKRPQIWQVFRLRLLEPITQGTEPVGYDVLIKRCGLLSPFEAQNLLATSKRIFSRHLQEVVTEYEGKGATAQLELKALQQFMDTLGGGTNKTGSPAR